jgi:serine/threonine protein phosphatase 1
MKEPLFVVGDVHGDSARLRELLPILMNSGRRSIFVGDYVNGGPDARGVIDLLLASRQAAPDRFVFLVGNHDLSLLDYMKDGDFVRFASLGGIPTIRSYVENVHGDVQAALVAEIPPEHVAFLRALEPFWESADVLVSHAGYDPNDPSSRTVESMVTRSSPSIFEHRLPPAPLVVCGHYVQEGGQPYISQHLICLDTGCGRQNGRLTAIRLPERDVITI